MRFINSSFSVFAFEQEIKQLFDYLLQHNFSLIWKKISDTLIAEDPMPSFNLKNILGSRTSYYGDNEGILFKYQVEPIFEWLNENHSKGKSRLAEMSPIFDPENSKSWHPFTLRLLNEYGDNDEVLNGLSLRFGNYSWVGSVAILYKSYRELFNSLLTHKNQKIKLWAQNMIIDLDNRIKREDNFDQEGFH